MKHVWKTDEMHTGVFGRGGGDLKERDHLEDLDVDGIKTDLQEVG